MVTDLQQEYLRSLRDIVAAAHCCGVVEPQVMISEEHVFLAEGLEKAGLLVISRTAVGMFAKLTGGQSWS